ncbi:MAG: DEAD/DEAH box helicase family protein [Thermodesulfobacteriota bacterium]|nr:DEAD/DEAH box helicase family protein [Thermodesulfobacteriota bacterium]
MSDTSEIDRLIEVAESELRDLETKRAGLLAKISSLKAQKSQLLEGRSSAIGLASVTSVSSEKEKIRLFRTLFRGREDVFPRRFESAKTGKSGYQPCCRKEWIKGLCRKPKIKCHDCESRDFVPVTDEVIKSHLLGRDVGMKRSRRDYTIGVYPLLTDETCWFLAVDFDKEGWTEDVSIYMDTCRTNKVPAVLERSRSGEGGHVWIFFSEPIPAGLARQLGAFILTEAMERRPEIGFDSYDRFFPSQDTMPRGGFGNLIALPLQKRPREKGNTLFIDDHFVPYPDQWAFLSSVRRMAFSEVEAVVNQASARGGILGVRMVTTDEEDAEPWLDPPSRMKRELPISEPLPKQIELVLENQIYIEKQILPPALKNRLIRLAAFQNPEFYKAQAMRFPTFDKPRIIHCCEDFPKYIGLPRGCLEEVTSLLGSFGIRTVLKDERFEGRQISAKFQGVLRPEQEKAVEALLRHDTGVLSASTAFGKTVVAAFLIAERKVNTLVMVHLRELLDQWIDRLATFLDIDPKKIGQIGGGKRKPTGIIDVAIIQSLSKKGIVDDIVGGYGHLVVDECHHVSARSFEIATRQSKAKYVTGLSATVVRKDGHHPIVFMNCGPIRHRVDDRTQAIIRPFAHKVVVRKTEFQLPDHLKMKEPLAIHELYAALISDHKRNNMIVEELVEAVKAGRFPVLLTERRGHLDTLEALLSSRVENIFVLKGGMGKKQRQALSDRMEGLEGDEARVMLATGRYLGEGFDHARLDTLFLALPVSWKGVLTQYAGRLHRLHAQKKEVLVYDYVDVNVPISARMYGRRVTGYKSIGYEIVE